MPATSSIFNLPAGHTSALESFPQCPRRTSPPPTAPISCQGHKPRAQHSTAPLTSPSRGLWAKARACSSWQRGGQIPKQHKGDRPTPPLQQLSQATQAAQCPPSPPGSYGRRIHSSHSLHQSLGLLILEQVCASSLSQAHLHRLPWQPCSLLANNSLHGYQCSGGGPSTGFCSYPSHLE